LDVRRFANCATGVSNESHGSPQALPFLSLGHPAPDVVSALQEGSASRTGTRKGADMSIEDDLRSEGERPEDVGPRTRFGLRTKLALGFGGLVLLLLLLGAQSISLLDRLSGSIDVILRENYVSVLACQEMKEALERMDSGALFALAGVPERGRALAAVHRPRFEAALDRELHNITVPGEQERAYRLRDLYSRYRATLPE